jgi:hypothetical protein
MVLAILQAEEVKWVALRGESARGGSLLRYLQRKTLQVAQQRVRAVLSRVTRRK